MTTNAVLRVLRIPGRVQIFIGKNLKIEKLSALCIRDSGDVDIRTPENRVDATNVKEQEPRLRGMGFDRLGGELRRLDLIHLFLADSAFHLVGQRDRAGPRAGLRIREPTI
jgi:hypothetical protein